MARLLHAQPLLARSTRLLQYRIGRITNLSYLMFKNPSPLRFKMMPRRSMLTHSMIQHRNFMSFPKLVLKVIRLPIALGGGLAAGGSYVVYKMEEATNYTSDQLSKLKEMTSGASDSVSSFFSRFWADNPEENGNQDSNNNSNNPEKGAGSAVAAATGVLIAQEDGNEDSKFSDEDDEIDNEDDDDDDDEEDEDDDEEVNNKKKKRQSAEDQMLNLTKEMIEIRSLLAQVDENDTLKLPSIVVVGSQSSGKSSVLEAIVGKQFLPKGNNMVTRRPIELTLIHTPDSNIETAEFPQLKKDSLTDFSEIANILKELNLAVPSSEVISENPIQLTIKSSKVPDLTLIDLPGYIQVESADQPLELKQKIRKVCMKYLEPPNIILAISSADVDLANSSALRAAKLVDPKGERTLGVITKMDLIDPKRGKELLKNNRYFLKMGYVGIISKAPSSNANTSIFGKKKQLDLSKDLSIFEKQFFHSSKNEKYFYNSLVGTKTLKKKLIKILETSMANSLKPTYQTIQHELEDASYKFKVEFNDRVLTPESYLASNLDNFKSLMKEFSTKFGKNEIKTLLSNELDQKVLNLLASRYWNNSNLKELSSATDQDLYWHRKLDLTTSSLTKLGVGRFSTTLITNILMDELNDILQHTNFDNNAIAKELIINSAVSIFNSKYYSVADQVENCIKPYKYEIDLEDREWNNSKEHTIKVMNEEIKQCAIAYKNLKDEVGTRKLKNVVNYLERNHTNEENLQFSQKLVNKGKEAMFYKDRLTLLQLRLNCIKSSPCNNKDNKYKCPEIFLNAVIDKLTQTSILFLNVELLSDFYYNFPRILDSKFSSLNKETVTEIAFQDEKVKQHIQLQKRKDLLEEASVKMEHLMVLKNSKS